MRIEDLVQLLDNRLREFKLSGDYARMNGDLERMNAADKEVIVLEDTLYKLNLLVDTSKSAAVKKASLTEVLTDGSIAVLGEYDITPYATDPLHEEKIMNILSKMAVMDTVEKIDNYIKSKYLSSPVTGEMIMSAALAYTVDARLMMAIMEQDSRFGTAGKAVRTLNPGNVGNDDSGNLRTYESWQEGVTAVAEWLNRHRISKIISEILEETILEPTATSTPLIITSTTATTTPVIATSTLETIPVITSTTTTATTTPVIATSTPTTATSTSTTTTATTTPVTTASPRQGGAEAGQAATTTPQIITPTATSTPVITTSTTTTATTTPVTTAEAGQAATTTPITASSGTPPEAVATTTTPATATTTPVIATSTEETIPVITSTTTTTTATSTDSTGSSQATTTQETADSTAN